MDGILTESGINAWLGGSKKLVHEYDTGVASATQSQKMTLFANSSQGKAMPEAGGLTLVGTATELGTSLVKEGVFKTESFVATHLGLQLLPHGVFNTTAADDKVAQTVTQQQAFIHRAYFAWYFSSGNEPADEGSLVDFPWSRGLAAVDSTEAETVITRGVTNGTTDGAPIKSPVRCSVNTKPRMEITFPKGAIATTTEMFVRAHVLGYQG